MTPIVVDLSIFPATPFTNANRATCQALSFTGTGLYKKCTQTGSRYRGQWLLCISHSRREELEIDLDEPTP